MALDQQQRDARGTGDRILQFAPPAGGTLWRFLFNSRQAHGFLFRHSTLNTGRLAINIRSAKARLKQGRSFRSARPAVHLISTYSRLNDELTEVFTRLCVKANDSNRARLPAQRARRQVVRG